MMAPLLFELTRHTPHALVRFCAIQDVQVSVAPSEVATRAVTPHAAMNALMLALVPGRPLGQRA